MAVLGSILIVSQLAFTFIASLYFYVSLKNQQNIKPTSSIDTKIETEKLKKLRTIKLNKPLSEKTRPSDFSEIIGQEKGIKALKASVCGANPQHIIIYGPPGIGKTAAARLALEHAKEDSRSPFKNDAPFVEIDATIMQFDERSVADPLIGSVHDPIYQGAGIYGHAGIPQPKAGAVTDAHGGILFIDEIGELHSFQLNKLLKVLEDAKVLFSSSYYSEDNKNIPDYIHDIFENGMPADFRLIGATTRKPEELPQALRSRCTEIFFRSLNNDEVEKIAENACKKTGFAFEENVPSVAAKFCSNGRDTVNIIQTACSLAMLEKRAHLQVSDIEEITDSGRHTPIHRIKINSADKIGIVNGLAITSSGLGSLLEIETIAKYSLEKGKGKINVTGIVEEEEINSSTGIMKRKSTAKSSVENVATVIEKISKYKINNYDIHINFPGAMPVDGPSAGIAIFTAIYSAISNKKVPSKLAMTGEISIRGKICPVGGVPTKIEAAIESGADTVIIPKENYRKTFNKYPIRIIAIETIEQLMENVFNVQPIVKYEAKILKQTEPGISI